MIKVFATGLIGKDAETRTVGEHTITQFSIASTKKFKDKKTTTWLNCQKWNAGRLSEFLLKGTKVEVAGELEIREHEGKYYTTLNVTDLEFGGSAQQKPQEQIEQAPESNGQEEPGDQDLPF